MSKIALTPNASGTGTFTLASPNSDTNRTFTLPDANGDLLTSNSSLNAAKLTGTAAAINGSNITNLAAANLTGALPAIGGSNLTSLTSSSLTGALPAIDGSSLTGIVTGRTYATQANTTSGTAFDFTGIPAGVKEVTVLFDACSVSGGYGVYIQMGTSAGINASGYSMNSQVITATGQQFINSFSEGIMCQADAETFTGAVKIERLTTSGHYWLVTVHLNGKAGASSGSFSILGGGVKNLVTELTQIRLKVERSASATFDNGTANIAWSY